MVGFFLFCLILMLTVCERNFEQYTCIHAIDRFPQNLNPGSYKTYNELQIFFQVYENLLKLSNDKKSIVPNLAESWNYSSDYHRLTFRLKPNILFHDHSKLNAYVAKYCIDWIRQKQQDSHYVSNIDSVAVIDSLTFMMKLTKADSRFIYYLASNTGIILFSKKAHLSNEKDIGRHPVGTGPFYLERWERDQIALKRFKKYRGAAGNIENLHFRLFPYSRQLEKALQKKELDVVFAVTGNMIDRLKWTGEIEYIVNESISCRMLAFNLQNDQIQNLNLRKAILTALDLQRMLINIYRGAAILAKNPLPPLYKDFSDLKQLSYNRVQSSKLLKKVPEFNKEIIFTYPEYQFQRPILLEGLKSYLRDQNISLKVQRISSNEEYNKAIKSASVHMFYRSWWSDILGDPGNFLWSLFYSTSSYNAFNYENDLVDSLLEKSVTEFDNKKRNEYYKIIVKQVLDDIPAIFLGHLKVYYAYNTKKIKIISMNPYGIINYKDVILHEAY